MYQLLLLFSYCKESDDWHTVVVAGSLEFPDRFELRVVCRNTLYAFTLHALTLPQSFGFKAQLGLAVYRMHNERPPTGRRR